MKRQNVHIFLGKTAEQVVVKWSNARLGRQIPDRAVKFPTGPSNSRLYGGNVKSNALGLPGGGGGLIAVGFDSYITRRRDDSRRDVARGHVNRSLRLSGCFVVTFTFQSMLFISFSVRVWYQNSYKFIRTAQSVIHARDE